jgi:aconitate hydratase
MSQNTFGSRRDLAVGDRSYAIFGLSALDHPGVERLPYSLKILLENLLRSEDGVSVTSQDIEALARWDPAAEPHDEIAFSPGRILMQDFTGVPAIVDLAAMRDGVEALGGDPARVNPSIPTELVIDHSVIVDSFGTADSFDLNARFEFDRNKERYQLLRWGQQAFDGLRVVPPETGICHQVNLEYLARVVFSEDGVAYPDTLVGTDSHTPMVNGLGVLGWGVGGIEAEAAMLGQPISMLVPRVVGFKLHGELPEGSTATDLVLTIAEQLRRHGVVSKFVEFYGPGVANVPLENRATIGNMSPEYGSTVTIFPIDDETLRYLRFTGRSDERVALVEAYAKTQGLWHDPSGEPVFSEHIELDLSTVEPSLAGPTRPQDRVALHAARSVQRAAVSRVLGASEGTPVAPGGVGRGRSELVAGGLDAASAESFPASDPPAASGPSAEVRRPRPDVDPDPGAPAPSTPTPVVLADGTTSEIDHSHVVIAAITSCTNTSNPAVMIAAGLLAKKAAERGLTVKPWVKTSLAPGSRVVMDYYERSGLLPYLEALGYHLVGFGCTTCIGNSGPIDPALSAVADRLALVSVLSGNRNFEGRINPDVRMNYLASPPLVVAFALAGTMDIDLTSDPLGTGTDGTPVRLADIWPSPGEVQETIRTSLRSEMFTKAYGSAFDGDERWSTLEVASGQRFGWDDRSTYVHRPPFFDGMDREPVPLKDIAGARCLAVLGASVTTDHISPAGSIGPDTPAGQWLTDHGVEREDFNSYGSRRGNHEVMVRGTFANIRLRNHLAPGTEGGWTRHQPSGEEMTIHAAATRYAAENVPLLILAGTEYGSGSSRDWAAKGTLLLGVRAVVAESFERIHRSNLIGMGVLPLQFASGDSAGSLGLTGTETYAVTGLNDTGTGDRLPPEVTVRASDADGGTVEFPATLRIDTPKEGEYYRHGGILQYVLRQLAR